MTACLKKRTGKKKKQEGTLVSLVRRKERDCKEKNPVSYPLLPHLGFVPSSRLGTEAEWKGGPWNSWSDEGGKRRLRRLRGSHAADSFLCGSKEGFLWEVPCHKAWGGQNGDSDGGRATSPGQRV